MIVNSGFTVPVEVTVLVTAPLATGAVTKWTVVRSLRAHHVAMAAATTSNDNSPAISQYFLGRSLAFAGGDTTAGVTGKGTSLLGATG